MKREIFTTEVIEAHRATIGDFRADFLLLGQGLNYEDVARVHALPIGTVKSRLSRARKALNAAIKAKQEV